MIAATRTTVKRSTSINKNQRSSSSASKEPPRASNAQSAEKYAGHGSSMGMPKKPITEKIDEEEDKYSDDQNAFINDES